MTSEEAKVHAMDLGRIVVEGDHQPIIQVATLTLKDGNQDEHLMQIHVDGSTLAQWDLGMLRERKSTGGEQFYSITEQKMLQFTLPLPEEEQDNLHRNILRTIQLFLVKHQDFHTAVSYLSKDVGMRHVSLKNLVAPIMVREVSKQSFAQPRSHDFSESSTMRPPTRRPSQAPFTGYHMQSRAQPIQRPFSTTPHGAFVPGDPALVPPRSSSAALVLERNPSQGYYDPLNLPRGRQGIPPPYGHNQPGTLSRRNPSISGVGDMTHLHQRPVHRAPMANFMPQGRLAQLNGRGVSYGSVSRGESVSLAGRVPSPASSARSSGTYHFSLRHSSTAPSEDMSSRSRADSARGFPIRIQVLDPSNELKYPYRQPKTRWEFTLSLLPEIKMFELCLHAAQYMSRNFHTIVDGRDLAAQSRDGTVLEDREGLSEEVLRGETLFLIERRLLDMDQPARRDFPRSSLDPLHPDWTSQAANHERSKSLFSAECHSQVDDESDQVPPPRKLPFALATAASSPRPPSSTAPTRPPLGERLDLVNASARAPFAERIVDSTTEDDREEANSKKQPETGQSRPQSVLERSASAARNRKVGSVPERNQQSETPTMLRRPRTSQGNQRKDNTAPNQGRVSSSISSAAKSNPSGAGMHDQELATSACMRCRKKKRKCDKSKPTCGPCQKDERQCIYPRSQGIAAIRSGAAKASPESDLAVTNHSSAFMSQASTSSTAIGNVPQQTSQAKKARDMGVQTQETEHGKGDVELKDAGTDPCVLYVDASTETAKCDDIWLPFSQCAKVVYWAGKRYEEKIQEAADILRGADPSQEGYIDKVQQAATHGFEFQQELQQKCEEVLRDLS